ncbi:hypothetical protein LTR10_014844 [Elasticomyces elasticus]|uniref:Major facilitator superfamily (MFS) profile domain-containing protein n=1 Tax=Exophiala sideris TaxID=1016849 RepID=A0ABR0JGP7_9EURO|nr:hypothetical protein LTR10_014844 [Elasticomyces elasticus]KAK5025687.1 hypothetical protein LTS07_007891 [Exophiala sideris]KAK5033104.1 hypothetical protein LTR13_007069 [Exophiala sideris]KAK5063589.1 hypothetical protein LTR69_004295 [Exophiala sideris]KAK5180578.1 hypothetical protein LTR44_006892 [Eurotiomycetes sp. CCFEE 6388]
MPALSRFRSDPLCAGASAFTYAEKKMSTFGILQEKSFEHTPGTAILHDDATAGVAAQAATGLKHGTGRYGHIVLVPQPTDDPDDPLNWPLWRKDLCLFSVALGSLCFTAVLVPMLSPATYALSIELNTSITAIAQLTGNCLLCVGAFGPFVSAMSRLWGKRPQFLLASLLGILGTIVGECANSYKTLLAGRLLQGLSVAAYESLIVALMGDMYFVHQRGARVTIFQLVTNTFGVLSPIIAGVIFDNLGWKYLFHIAQPFLIAQLVMVFFFVPETSYHRPEIYNTDVASTERLEELKYVEVTESEHARGAGHDGRQSASTLTPKTTWQRLSVYNGRFSRSHPLKLVVAPFVCLANPAAVWGCLTQGISSGWWVATSFVLAQIFSVPPYNLSTAGVGYLYVGPFIGGLLGVLFMSFTSDPLARFVAKRNRGVYEPEFRLYPMILALTTGTIGLFLYGHMIEDGKGYYVASALHGIYGFSVNTAGAVMNSYVVDAFREESTEMLVIAMVFKNFFFFSLAYWVNNYLSVVGPARYFDVQGGIVVGIYALSIPMYVFGKLNRGWWRRHDLINKMGMGDVH